jgi:hypothetical protein
MHAAWGQWSRQLRIGPDSRLRCYSIEGRHIAELGSTFSDIEPHEPDIPDAFGLRVERAVLSTGRTYALALTAHYVELAPAVVIARRIGVRDARPVLDEAHRVVAERLR